MYTRRSKNKVVRRRPQRSRKRIRVLGSTGGKWASETTAADRRRCDQLNARRASFTLLRGRVWQRSLTGAAFVRSAARPLENCSAPDVIPDDPTQPLNPRRRRDGLAPTSGRWL